MSCNGFTQAGGQKVPQRSVLVVDDDVQFQRMVQQTLAREGYAVRLVADAEKALEVLKKEAFHVAFIDLNLPGMNGVELCSKIRNDKPMSIMYAVTGFPSLFELSDC
ncbi:MAG TPA: response regulator, partial [Chromatiaceae bacterium]|nr:response regulator [Chromatiaceae bacterium]